MEIQKPWLTKSGQASKKVSQAVPQTGEDTTALHSFQASYVAVSGAILLKKKEVE